MPTLLNWTEFDLRNASIWKSLILTSAVAVLATIVGSSVFRIPKNELTDPNIPSVLRCSNSTVFNTNDEKIVGFTVSVETQFVRSTVFKTPMTEDDHVVKMGTDVIWHGIYNIKEAPEIPKTTLTFEAENNKCGCISRRKVILECTKLKAALLERSKVYSTYRRMRDEDKQTQESNRIECRDVKIYEPAEYLGYVDFSVVIDNPFDKVEEVAKYPMIDNDKLLIAGKEIIWYGSASKLGVVGLSSSILSLKRNKCPSFEKYFELSCPELEEKIHNIISKNEETKEYASYSTFCFLAVVLILFVVGICSGDRMAQN